MFFFYGVTAGGAVLFLLSSFGWINVGLDKIPPPPPLGPPIDMFASVASYLGPLDGDLVESLTSYLTPTVSRRSRLSTDRPGVTLAAQGATVRHPVLMVPGVVTSGLELWKGERCAREYFRQKIWGSTSMFSLFFEGLPMLAAPHGP